jgi:hypothetical protein
MTDPATPESPGDSSADRAAAIVKIRQLLVLARRTESGHL